MAKSFVLIAIAFASSLSLALGLTFHTFDSNVYPVLFMQVSDQTKSTSLCASGVTSQGVEMKSFVYLQEKDGNVIVPMEACNTTLCRFNANIFFNGKGGGVTSGYSFMPCSIRDDPTNLNNVKSYFQTTPIRTIVWDNTIGCEYFPTLIITGGTNNADVQESEYRG